MSARSTATPTGLPLLANPSAPTAQIGTSVTTHGLNGLLCTIQIRSLESRARRKRCAIPLCFSSLHFVLASLRLAKRFHICIQFVEHCTSFLAASLKITTQYFFAHSETLV